MSKRSEKIRKTALELELPVDVAFGDIKVTVNGAQRVWVENHQGILEFGKSRMRFKHKGGEIAVTGQEMELEQTGGGCALIVGAIAGISFSGGSGGAL